MLRKINMFLVIGMLASVLAHSIAGSMKLAGASTGSLKVLAWVGVGFIAAHVIVTTVLGAETLHARKMSGAGYFKDNALFWTRRISGFVIIIPLIMHLFIFSPGNEGAFRLEVFTTGRLISQILLVAAIALHVLTNIKPFLISLGVRDSKGFAIDLMLILSVLMLLFGLAFVIYYIRWMSV